MNVLSLKVSDISVIPNIMTIEPMLDGIVSRLVWKVSKPRLRSDRVRYVDGGDTGILNISPL